MRCATWGATRVRAQQRSSCFSRLTESSLAEFIHSPSIQNLAGSTLGDEKFYAMFARPESWQALPVFRTHHKLCGECQTDRSFHFNLTTNPDQAHPKILPIQASRGADQLEILVVVEQKVLSLAAGPQAAGAPVLHSVDDHCGPQAAFGNQFLGYRVVRFSLSLRVHHPHFPGPFDSF